jgi:hypothetical protein
MPFSSRTPVILSYGAASHDMVESFPYIGPMKNTAASHKTVVCTKWGTKFPAEEVNRLYRMVRKHVSGPLRFVCFTDDPNGFAEGVESFPLPPVPVVGHLNNRGWKKLGLLASPLGDLAGPVLYLDLDVVLVDSLDPFFELPGAFRVIKDYKPFRYRHPYTGNTSVFRFEVGAHADVLEAIAAMGERVMRDFRNEQEVISYFMREKGILDYWPRPWCASYKHDCVHLMPLGLFKAPRIPAGAKVLVFHGTPKPEEAVEGKGSKWYRVIRPAPWLRDLME